MRYVKNNIVQADRDLKPRASSACVFKPVQNDARIACMQPETVNRNVAYRTSSIIYSIPLRP